jgi:hypothetical protein
MESRFNIAHIFFQDHLAEITKSLMKPEEARSMKKTYRKVKQYVKDHREDIYDWMPIAIAAAGTAAAVVVVTMATAKEAEEQKKIDDWTREQNFDGKTVYELADGSYIAVSKDQVS